MKCFISRSFRDEDKRICTWFKELLRAFGDDLLEAGNRPNPPREQIDQLIDEADMLCAVVSSRDGAVPQWISYEITRAYDRGIPVFGFIEEGIADLGSLPSILTYKPFNRRSLGHRAPEYVAYICEARRIAYQQLGLSRKNLLIIIRQLTAALELEEAMRNREDE